ncbi:MAG TPA: hypothetical protein VE091_04175 [Gemmatimonadales bacterium]|jgi:hypothetical protein|nr:hypothetical protein [Gemmatimonadales bacterium]
MTLIDLRTVAVFHRVEVEPAPAGVTPADGSLVRWLLEQLRRRADFQVDEPVHVERGAFIPVRHGRAEYRLSVVKEEPPSSAWVLEVQDPPRFLAGRWERREPQAHRELIELVHDALRGGTGIRDLAWHYRPAYERGDPSTSAPTPAGQGAAAAHPH